MGLFLCTYSAGDFFHFTIYPGFLSMSVDRALPHYFLKAVCGMRKWCLKSKTWRMSEIREARGWFSKEQSPGKWKRPRSPELFLLPAPGLPFSGPPPSLYYHLSLALICKAIQLPLSCPSLGEVHSSCQATYYFPKQRAIYPEKNYAIPLTDKSSCRQLWF